MASGKSIIQILKDYEIDKPLVVRLTGHTDTSGSDEYNLKLSRERAVVVKALLADGGIPVNDIAVNFSGEADPVRPTADGVKEQRNRRVEVEFE